MLLVCSIPSTQSASLGLSPPSQLSFQNSLGSHEQLPLSSTDNDVCVSCLLSPGHPTSPTEHQDAVIHVSCSLPF